MNFRNKIILAPMVSVNDIAFRKLCTYYGADIVYSQMISSEAFIRGSDKLVDFFDEENVIAQFFGNDPEVLAKCAKGIEKKVKAIDLNLGCPHSNVVKNKCGSYLMRYPKRISAIIKKLTKAVDIPITAKIRSGYDKHHINAVEIAKVCEKQGAAAIAVHGRPRTINYNHPVDYDVIKDVKRTVKIPVIGNGDISDCESAKKMFDRTGCDSVMVGRGAIGNPSIFNEIKDCIKGKNAKGVPKKRAFLKYIRYTKKYKTEFIMVKKHAQWFTKGMERGGHYRALMNNAKNIDEIKKIYNLLE